MKQIFTSMLLFPLTLLGSVTAGASVLKGSVTDSISGEPEAFSTVRIFSGSSRDKLLNAILTDENGCFSYDIKKHGKYILAFSSFGKKEREIEITVADSDEIDLGVVAMAPETTTIDEFVVVAQKPLVKMTADNITYNVAEDSSSKTQTLLDMLRKVPMVTVDGEDNITVNGSSTFQVYVDGKPSLMFSGNPSQIFKSMPASAVRSIEVVTNPGARYDAEGTGGVLNLIMDKSNREDLLDKVYNATVGVQAGNRGYNGSIYANGKTGRLTTSLNLIYNNNQPGETAVTNRRTQEDGILEMSSTGKPDMKFAMGNLAFEYEIDSVSTIGASVAVNKFDIESEGNSFTSFEGLLSRFSYESEGIQRNGRNNISGSIDFSRFFGEGKRNQLSATYQIQSEKSDNKSIADFGEMSGDCLDLMDRTSDNKENTLYNILQVDFNSRLNKRNTISAGGKLTLRDASSDAKYYLAGSFDSDGSMNYDNRNTIAALYGEYAFATDNVSLKGGVRYEHTWQSVRYNAGQGQDFKNDYGIIVPSASISYSFSPSSNLGMNYNMRISRPGISYLNPYVDRSNPTVLTYGNPDLDVEKAHNLGVVYNMFNSKFMMNLTLSYNYTGNGIEQFSFMDGDILNTTYGNIVKRRRTGLNAYINWMPFTKTRLFLNGSVSYTHIKSSELDLSNNGWQGNAMVGLQQTLPLDIKLGAFMMCSSKNYTLQGWNSGFQIITLNLSKSFLDNNLNVSIGGMSGLSDGGTMAIRNYSANGGFSNYNSIKIPMAGFNIGVSYTFGNSKSIRIKNNRNVNDDFINKSSEMESIPSSGMGGM